MKTRILTLIIFFALVAAKMYSQNKKIESRVDSVLKLMTLQEKIGQMNQYNDDGVATGPVTKDGDKPNQIRNGQLGSILNVIGVDRIREFQKIAMESRLRIPLIFGQDVIHGYKTTFPIPLAEASSWDLNSITLSAKIAAKEAAAGGIQWTFAPMVDIARDPRWGRVMEGAGEDPYLGSEIAKARILGFQGTDLSDTLTIMACAKHFAAYGAAEGGRDYNSVDMSEYMLRNIYLPPFKASVDAGVSTLMNSFNDLNGIPATANKYILREILKEEWNFKGFVVSDWGSVGEMINHGFVKDGKDAALSAVIAGCDMDMESRCYKNNLETLVKEGKLDTAIINESVRRILYKKFELGLFDDPFKYCNTEREKTLQNNPEHLLAARDMGKKSIVLLKNEDNILPLSKDKKIAFIGPLVKEHKQNMGFWAVEIPNVDYNDFVISQWEGVSNKIKNKDNLLYAKGCEIQGSDTSGFNYAVEIAMKADIVLLSIGEEWNMTGEAKSRSDIHIPGVQEDLLKAIKSTGKPVIVILNAGRPLIFNYTSKHADAILYSWWLGTQAGNSIADVLFGDYNPSAKLPMTFPREIGQIPIYYNHFNTGRPAKSDSDLFYTSSYIDLSNSPKYAFGYGLSYTSFKYSELKLSSHLINSGNDNIDISFVVSNNGAYAGEEVVQMYIRDQVGSMVRPIKELKGFEKIYLDVGESKTVHFVISKQSLSFYNSQNEFKSEPGDFDLMIGSASNDIRLTDSFILE